MRIGKLFNDFHFDKDESKVSTFMIPLEGKENSFLYKTDSCEYIIRSATGKEEKIEARWGRTFVYQFYINVTILPGQCVENGREWIEER